MEGFKKKFDICPRAGRGGFQSQEIDGDFLYGVQVGFDKLF